MFLTFGHVTDACALSQGHHASPHDGERNLPISEFESLTRYSDVSSFHCPGCRTNPILPEGRTNHDTTQFDLFDGLYNVAPHLISRGLRESEQCGWNHISPML